MRSFPVTHDSFHFSILDSCFTATPFNLPLLSEPTEPLPISPPPSSGSTNLVTEQNQSQEALIALLPAPVAALLTSASVAPRASLSVPLAAPALPSNVISFVEY